jgi:hypothetical protein
LSILLQICPKDSAGKIYATIGTGAPTHYHNGLPFDGTGLAIDTASAIALYAMGLPFTAAGRLATVDAAATSYGAGAAPFNSAGRLCAGDAAADHYTGGVGYTANDRVAIVSSGGGDGVVIVTDPEDATVPIFTSALFSVVATGAATLTYQWQVSTDDGGSWGNITNTPGAGGYSGATTATLTCITVQAAQQNYDFRCVVTNSVNSATSASANLFIEG